MATKQLLLIFILFIGLIFVPFGSKTLSPSHLVTENNDFFPKNHWCLELIDAYSAWNITKGSEEIIIAVIDTGVDWLHPELLHAMWINKLEIPNDGIDNDGNGYVDDIYGFDFRHGDPDPMDSPSVAENQGHGTFCAGEIAANDVDNYGITGIAPGVKIMAIRIQLGEGDPDATELAGTAADAVNYAVNNGANIISASWGGPGNDPSLETAVLNAIANNVFFVSASGNDNNNLTEIPEIPSIYPGVFNVGSVHGNKTRVWYSNYGDILNVVAPGYDIPGIAPRNTATEASFTINGIKFESMAVVTEDGYDPLVYTPVDGLTADLVYCGIGQLSQFPENVTGNIALIDRGELTFTEKVQNAATKGAAGVVIANNAEGEYGSHFIWIYGTGDHPDPVVPAIRLSYEEGIQVKETMAAGILEATMVSIKSNYTEMSGTSMACPFVSGVVGLMMSANSTLKMDLSKIKQLIYNTVLDLGIPGKDDYYGYGLIQAGLAVKAASDSNIPKILKINFTWEDTKEISVAIEFNDTSGIMDGTFYYREKGNTTWESVEFNYLPSPEIFNATIGPLKNKEVPLEYYIEMTDFAGLIGNDGSAEYPNEFLFVTEQTNETSSTSTSGSDTSNTETTSTYTNDTDTPRSTISTFQQTSGFMAILCILSFVPIVYRRRRNK